MGAGLRGHDCVKKSLNNFVSKCPHLIIGAVLNGMGHKHSLHRREPKR